MKVLLVYDKPPPVSAYPGLPEDFGAEYEDGTVIDRLLDAISACGYEAVGLALDEDFPRRIRLTEPDIVFNIAEGVRG